MGEIWQYVELGSWGTFLGGIASIFFSAITLSFKRNSTAFTLTNLDHMYEQPPGKKQFDNIIAYHQSIC